MVGAFIIFNTFSITVAQRTREFGLLRTLGGSRAQIMRAVVYEGFLLGTVGAVLGLFGGLLLAPALDQLFKAFGADLPDSGTVLETRTIVVSLAVGIGVTVLAGLAPAIRATRVPPLAAMREGIGIPPRPLPTKRQLIARFLIGIVVVLVIAAVTGGRALGFVLLVAWSLRAVRLGVRLRRGGERPARHYRIVPALARAIGSLIAWRGITARLARENSIRQPGRTLTTAAALTVGLALVTLVAVLADGTKATIDQRGQPLVRGQPDRRELPIRQRSRDSCAGGTRAATCPGSGCRDTGRLHHRASARQQQQRLDHRDRTRDLRPCIPRGMEARLECHAAGARRQRHDRRQGIRKIAQTESRPDRLAC